MKALTLTQPWATLVAIGAKRIETRSWNTRYCGLVAIHAAKAFPKDAKALVNASGFRLALMGEKIDFGAVVAIVRLVDCCPTVDRILNPAYPSVFRKYPHLDTEQERAFGNYEPGRWAWVLEFVHRFEKPILAKGALGLWEWNDAGKAL